MNKNWYPVLFAAAVLAALALAAVPLYLRAQRAARAAELEAEAARLAAEERELRGELSRLAVKTDRLLAAPFPALMIPEHGPEEGRGAEDLARLQGETQGLLFRIGQGPPRPKLKGKAEALAARQRKAWLRLNRQARRAAGKREAK